MLFTIASVTWYLKQTKHTYIISPAASRLYGRYLCFSMAASWIHAAYSVWRHDSLRTLLNSSGHHLWPHLRPNCYAILIISTVVWWSVDHGHVYCQLIKTSVFCSLWMFAWLTIASIWLDRIPFANNMLFVFCWARKNSLVKVALLLEQRVRGRSFD